MYAAAETHVAHSVAYCNLIELKAKENKKSELFLDVNYKMKMNK